MMKKGAKVGVLCFMTAAFFAGQCFSAMSGVGNLLIDDPEVIGFLGNGESLVGGKGRIQGHLG